MSFRRFFASLSSLFHVSYCTDYGDQHSLAYGSGSKEPTDGPFRARKVRLEMWVTVRLTR